ncbi:MAG: 16S rRNA (cytosine(1402)-N(4))-methyltransferase RsmH [Eubacterium sp.]|jgi:16S rRNA (cytosine1402-N4)-methyltransferase
MDFSHVPVLLGECIENLAIREDGTYADGTLGGGGHSEEICKRLSPKGTLIGIDKDEDALAAAEQRLRGYACRKIFVHSDYADIRQILAELSINGLDGALLDLGVSSFQLDNPERGFSYMHDAPLDMRMDQSDALTARKVVNEYSEKELARIIREYGEERWASRIAHFISEARRKKEIDTTGELVEIIKAAVPASARREGPHPAKRTFQAIRIEVNGELDSLSEALGDFIDVLNPGGRLCVISFHSLEDRIVKRAYQEAEKPDGELPKGLPVKGTGTPGKIKRITKKPILPSEEEEETNPRARSAKLRVCEKL